MDTPPLSGTTATLPASYEEQEWLARAIAGVLRNAQDGDLPLFAWTLGLPQPALLAMISQCFPELGPLEPMPEPDYASVRATVPAEFAELVALLLHYRSSDVAGAQADWLARAVAAACFGERHLWEDLGLAGRDAVSGLLRYYFAPLYQRNTAKLRWKHFLFTELAAARGSAVDVPPGCGKCGDFPLCFPDAGVRGQ